jgi:antitoxin PrlF
MAWRDNALALTLTMQTHYHDTIRDKLFGISHMSAHNEVESTLTDRYQTTVPEPVRKALQLGKRDRIHYYIREDGAVLLSKVATGDSHDPLLGSFLQFLAQDLAVHPERLRMLGEPLARHIRQLVQDVDVDLEQPLPEEDA